MNEKINNIFAGLPDFPQDNEIFDVITRNNNIKIERIVSTGQSSPENFWYNQEQNEFVLLLSGKAELEFEDHIVTLTKGDYLLIRSGMKHRVRSTDDSEHTIWLAVFFD